MGLNKSKNLSAAKKTADEWFSKFVRKRDADQHDMITCCTCGERHHYKSSAVNCGHFVPRGRLITRYDEKNSHAQCVNCNMTDNGEQYKHGLFIDKKYGEGTADALLEKSKQMIKFTKEDVMEMAREFKRRFDEMA